MENLKMKKHELGDWLSLRGFPLGAKGSSTHLYTLQERVYSGTSCKPRVKNHTQLVK